MACRRCWILLLISKGDIVSVKSIAERQNISESYLEQVFSILRKAAIVKSIKGAQGGYVLADDPSNITVGKILRHVRRKPQCCRHR